MGLTTWELTDNRWVGCSIIEIKSYPKQSQGTFAFKEEYATNHDFFQQMLQELFRLCVGRTVVVELLWLTEKIENQIFSAKVNAYFVIRGIDNDKHSLEAQLMLIQQSLISALESHEFITEKKDALDSKFIDLLKKVNVESMYSVAKAERYEMHSGSLYPYYYCDIIPSENFENFESIIRFLSQYEGCCISYQLFATTFNSYEIDTLNEITAELNQIIKGFSMDQGSVYSDVAATIPYKVLSYYKEHEVSPLFQYNILIFSQKSICGAIAAKLIGLLSCGKKNITSGQYTCLDLSEEKVDLQSQFIIYPWNINNNMVYKYRNQNYQQNLVAKALARLPYLLTIEEAVSFFRLPLYNNNLPMISKQENLSEIEQFSESVTSVNSVLLGYLSMENEKKIRIGCSEKTFTRHSLITGMSGYGKTTLAINLLLEFYQRNIPFLAIEPTKKEYRAMIDIIPDLQIFTPGNNTISPFFINAFLPPKNITLEQYIPSLMTVFSNVFTLPSPLDSILPIAIRNCYAEYGWKDYSKANDLDVKIFGIYEFIKYFKKYINRTYSKNRELRNNIESAGVVRLVSLIEQNPNIYDTIASVPVEDILSKPTVIELNSIESLEQKSFLMGLILAHVCLYTKANASSGGDLKNIMLIDEAHVLLGGKSSVTQNDGVNSQSNTIRALENMIVEIRSHGTGIIIADQEPSKVGDGIVANTDIKISFKLVSLKNKRLLADATNMSEESLMQLSRLPVGKAMVHFNQLEYPQIVSICDTRTELGIRLDVEDAEIMQRVSYWKNAHTKRIPYNECKYCKYCISDCDSSVRSNAEYYATLYSDRFGYKMVDKEKIIGCLRILEEYMFKDGVAFNNNEKFMRLATCTKIKLLRKLLIEGTVQLTMKEYEFVLNVSIF